MFGFEVDGALDIGNSGIKVALYKNKKIEKIDYINYSDMNEDKIMLLQESLDKMSKKVNLRGKKMVVTMPASNFM